MSDDFLYEFQESPRPEFAEALYNRIAKRSNPMRNTIVIRVALGLAALILIFALTMLAFPTARAAVLNLIRNIGGITFEEVDTPPHSLDLDKVKVLAERTVSLTEARELLPLPFTIPSWAPEGYRLYKDNVHIAVQQPDDFPYLMLHLEWRKSAIDNISLMIMYSLGEEEPTWYAPTDLVDEVTVNGQPAAVVQGTWREENGEASVTTHPPILIWKRDGITYQLTANNRKVSLEDLIRMAESAP